ncbi:flagellar basal body L-ring protein FlgH [Henriciella aquimarina]|uniref:flagellar basal body L-ring protein FlgH n=1 Tax=Henriciella aquimarina TaxID=545261 RepID=UPI001F2DF797|nr:flagellar basal body L-ring protein FlgH [Henriciella aquimarina]
MKPLLPTAIAAILVTACSSGPAQQTVQMPAPPPPGPVMSQPAPTEVYADKNSLWTTSPTALLGMRRAKQVGDLLTVVVEMDDQASLQSSLSRSRDNSGDFNVDALFGLPDVAGGVLPNGASLSPGVDYNRSSSLGGSGAVNRAEQIAFTLAARVVGVEPNGNLVIQGYQQTRVSNEVRVLTVSGVIRAQDITRTNTVTYEKIADAQLSYINSGEATASVDRGAGPKLLDMIIPF